LFPFGRPAWISHQILKERCLAADYADYANVSAKQSVDALHLRNPRNLRLKPFLFKFDERHFPVALTWEHRSNPAPLIDQNRDHLKVCERCVFALGMCQLSLSFEELQQLESDLHNPTGGRRHFYKGSDPQVRS
jgi:hypothetical protein